MNELTYTEQENLIELEQNQIIDEYKQKGFIKDKQDEEDLHRSYSPYRVPKNLTKLKIRRKINEFIKNGRKLDYSLLNMNGLEIRINGKMMFHTSFVGKAPDDNKSLVKLLKEVISVITSKKSPPPKGF